MKLSSHILWTYLTLQIFLFGAFLYFPLFSVENFFFFKKSNNIINILLALFEQEDWFLFSILFAGTVFMPSMKFVFSVVVHKGASNKVTKKLLFFFTKWSMLDLLLIALAVTIFKLSYFTEMKVEIGSYFLFGFVLLSIVFEETSN
jgi:paraquat-inducible protein A